MNGAIGTGIIHIRVPVAQQILLDSLCYNSLHIVLLSVRFFRPVKMIG